jgi:ribose transport system permease protein
MACGEIVSMATETAKVGAGFAGDRSQMLKSLVQALGMLPVLILIAIAFHVATGKFLNATNIAIVMQQASINIVLAAGMTFVILTGGIDLSVGSVLAASAVVAVATSLSGLSFLAMPLALLCGLILGAINGSLVAFMRLPPFIVTLGTMTAVRGVARLLGNDTTVFNPSLPFAWIGNARLFGVPWLVIIALAVIAISWFILRRTVLGVRIYAVGGNPDAARLSGISLRRHILTAFCVMSALAGLASLLQTSRVGAASPDAGQYIELDAIAACVIGGTSLMGGRGTVFGAMLGALIMASLDNGMSLLNVQSYVQYIVKGAVLVAAVGFDMAGRRR